MHARQAGHSVGHRSYPRNLFNQRSNQRTPTRWTVEGWRLYCSHQFLPYDTFRVTLAQRFQCDVFSVGGCIRRSDPAGVAGTPTHFCTAAARPNAHPALAVHISKNIAGQRLCC
eukprot:gene10596-biopygen5571